MVAGSVAGSPTTRGYICIKVDWRLYRASRLAWLYMTGAWPTGLIDHQDLKTNNNSWSNLREATHSLNAANSRQKRPAIPKGVTISGGRIIAQIKVRGRRRYLGDFKTVEDAHAAYAVSAREAFGQFSRMA